MIIKLRIKSWQASLALTRLTTVVGVNSNLPNGNHILMWDFDEVGIIEVRYTLGHIQNLYSLPEIHILSTGQTHHYIAYCFVDMPWIKTVEIIAATQYIDQNYFRLGVIRKHWTLRISNKDNKKIRKVCTLLSIYPPTLTSDDLISFTEYDTMKHGFPKKVINIAGR
jgi:hypothetical protein